MRKFLNEPVDARLALAFYILLLVLGTILIGVTSCKTAKQIAVENEQRRREHMALLEETRTSFPCDTSRIYSVDTLFQFVQGDTVRVGDDILIHDTIVVKRSITKFMLDSAWLQLYRDSLSSLNYAFDVARDDASFQQKRADKAEALLPQYKKDTNFWQRAAMITWGILAMLVGGAIFSKIKGII